MASSLPFRDVDAFAPATDRAVRIFTSRGASGIDGTLATALGEAIALAPAPVVALVGDLACLHDAGGLLHAGEVADAVNLTVVVPDNGGGGIFGQLPIAAHPDAFERCFLTPQRADLGRLAGAAGVRYARITQRAALEEALARAVQAPGVDVLHVPVDRVASAARRRAAWAAASGGGEA
ncbi:MAG: thiamine pyrophosphate-dependent enzyme [bacterium]